jgi:hypothetical protein
MRFPNKVLKHLLRNFEVGYYSVSHRTDGHDISWRSTQHFFRVFADGFDAVSHLINSDD